MGSLAVFLMLTMAFQGFIQTSLLLTNIALVPLQRGYSQGTLAELEALESADGSRRSDVKDQAATIIGQDAAITTLDESQRAAAVAEMTRRWVDQGTSSQPKKTRLFTLPLSELARPEIRHQQVTVCSLLVLLGLLMVAVLGWGMANQDLGRVSWGTLWLVSLPVTDRVLFTALLVEYSLTMLLIVPFAGAFLTACAISAGHGWWSPVLALAVCIPLALVMGGISLAGETWARLHLAHAARKNIQAACSILGLSFMGMVMGIMMVHPMPAWALAVIASGLWTGLPSAWPVHAMFAEGYGALTWLLALYLVGVATASACVAYCAHAVRRGFLAEPGGAQGVRQAERPAVPGSWSPLSLIGKDLLMLARDRAFLVGALVAPLFGIGLQFLVNPHLAGQVLGSFRHACVLAFSLGAYVLVNAATTVLSAEGNAVWMLTSAPHRLERLLLHKVALWAAFASAYALVAVAVAVWVTPWPGWMAIPDALMVLLGVPLFAVIAAGLGAAASDPLAVEVQRRIDPSVVVLIMLLVGIYSGAIYVTDGHVRLLFLMLIAVLAYALWQRLAGRLQWLLDPTDAPPRRLGLADGAIAALAFLVAQSTLMMEMVLSGADQALALVVAFAGAGAVVAALALFVLWRARLPGLLAATGIWPAEGLRPALLPNLAWGMVGGLVAAGAGLLYLGGLSQFPALMPVGSVDLPWWALISLMVVAAPLAEEFIFRGLLFAGLRSSISVAWAIPASAAVFALIHPTVSIAPVFVLGCITAYAYHRSGWLLAPILVHAVYNAVMVSVSP